MRIFAFCNCEVWEWADRAYLETRWSDGTTVPASPKGDIEQAFTAVDLGYGPDVWRMCREHEFCHHILAEAIGLPRSATLWAVAHPNDPDNISLAEQHAEEAMILAFQRYTRTKEIRPEIYGLAEQAGATLEELADHARRIMRGEPSRLENHP